MADVQKILEVVSEASRQKDQLQARLSEMIQSNGHTEVVNKMVESLLKYHGRHHPEPMMCVTDAQGIILEVDDTYCRVSKYSREELVGQNINILKSFEKDSEEPKHKEMAGLFRDMWNNISEGRVWFNSGKDEVILNRAKDYNLFPIDLIVVPILGSDGKPEKYWSLAYDISEKHKDIELLESQKKEIEDSIKYAKRIQKTILPEKSVMDWMDKDWFVLYRPKDVVSGDFYWFARNIRTAFVAVVDCTGHGVPGAFMSLIGFNLLNQIVSEATTKNKDINPGEILTELHKLVRTTLKQDSSDESRDGMDVCMVAIDKYDDSFQYAAANRPLYFWHDGDLQEIKPDKMSIGGEQLEQERKFKNQVFEVGEGDAIYMVSDGFTDQFGGPEEPKKKFSTKRLKQLIIDSHHEKMSVQRAMFNLAWKDWIGDDEQIDDVTLIGIKF
jgi:PAS domain S-box-containing protein